MTEEKSRLDRIRERFHPVEASVRKFREFSSGLYQKLKSVLVSKKALPLYFVLAALYISSFRTDNFLFADGALNFAVVHSKLQTVFSIFSESIFLGSSVRLATTLLAIGTVWTIYSYWLKDLEILESTHSLLKKISLAGIAAIVLFRHVKPGSPLSALSQWSALIFTVYAEVVAFWFLVKTVDSIDLSSDLKNWGLKILGPLLVLAGSVASLASEPVLTTAYTARIYSNSLFLGGLLLMVTGAFMIYRSTRREPALKIW